MKNLKKLGILVLIVLVFVSSLSIATEENTKKIISMSNETIAPNGEFYLILNASNIEYTKFKVEITNSQSLSAGELTDSVSSLSTNNIVTSFIVDKNTMSLGKLGIVFTAPEQLGKVDFDVKITNLDETVDTLKEDLTTIITDITTLENTMNNLADSLKGVDTTTPEYTEAINKIEEIESAIETKKSEKTEVENKLNNFAPETISETASIKVEETKKQEVTNDIFGTIEKNEVTNQNVAGQEGMMPEGFDKESISKNKEDMMKMEKENEEMNENMKEMMTKMSDLETNLKSANDTISSLTQNTQYKGSQNNYLESLSITGIELGKEFKKTTTNYFVTVDKSVNSVTINAVPKDSDAIVTIYGNTDLQEGKNKILINVTAENGDVRTYKIYVTK